jgi:hypothetical protein
MPNPPPGSDDSVKKLPVGVGSTIPANVTLVFPASAGLSVERDGNGQWCLRVTPAPPEDPLTDPSSP